MTFIKPDLFPKLNLENANIYVADHDGNHVFSGPANVYMELGTLKVQMEDQTWEFGKNEVLNYTIKSAPDEPLELTYTVTPALGYKKGGLILPPDGDDFVAAPSPFKPVMTINISMTLEQTLEALQRAKNVLMENGWIKGHLEINAVTETGERVTSYCTLGAISRALVDMNLAPRSVGMQYDVSKTAPALAILEALGGVDTIPAWNDNVRTQLSDVMNAFDRAILTTKEKIAEGDE